MIIQHYRELLRLYRGRLILLMLVSAAVFAAVSVVKLRVSPTYTATASVLITPTEAELVFSAQSAGRAQAGRALTETYIEYVKSRPVIEAALDKIARTSPAAAETQTQESSALDNILQQVKDFAGDIARWRRIIDSGEFVPLSERDKEIQRTQEAITIDKVVDSHILRIVVSLDDPRKATYLANTLAQAYVERMSAELNDTVSQLEQRLDQEIERLESNRSRLQGQLAALKRRQGELPEDNDQQYQLDLVQQQLATLYSRMLSTNLTRESVISQVRVIEPAVQPVYPSSPHVVTNTLLGLLTGLLLGIIIIVISDTASETIKTTADLGRIAGVRSIGLLKRSWITNRHKRELRNLGNLVERRLTALGDFETTVPQITPAAFPPAEVIGYENNTGPVRLDNLHALNTNRLTVNQPDPVSVTDSVAADYWTSLNPVLQVTGFSDIRGICLAALGLAMALAMQGRKVVCRLPEGIVRNPPRFEKGLSNRLKVETAGTETVSAHHDSDNAIIVNCLGPLSSDLSLSKARHQASALICVIPQNQVPENLVEALQQRTAANRHINLSFMLMLP